MDTLLVGNTGYMSKETIDIAFASDNVVVCGSDLLARKDGNVSFYNESVMSDKFRRLFEAYSFERIVFFSYFLNKDSNEIGEIDELRRVCSLAQKHHASQFVYITSNESSTDLKTSDSVILDSIKNVCLYYSSTYRLDIKIVYSPCLMYAGYEDDYWCRILKQVENKVEVEINALWNETADFLKVCDLMEFLGRLFDVWGAEETHGIAGVIEEIHLASGARTSYGEIKRKISQAYKGARIRLPKSGVKQKVEVDTNVARQKYGWFSKHDACWDFEDFIEDYQKNFHIRPSLSQIIRKKLKIGRTFLMIAELILGAAFVEMYNILSGGSVQFKMIDVRLLFVVLMSLVYGTKIGVITAFIEIVSLLYAFALQGVSLVQLFYNPGNWIPFILLLAASAICGYIKQKGEEDSSFVNEENETLKSENSFITQLYHEAMDYKNRYKADLIGSRDGFGRIFDVVKRLSTTVPEEIFAESIPVMEDVLDNKSIAIYTINDTNARFARLNVSSESISQQLKKSINLEEYSDVLETLKENEIWFNNDVREGYPTYVTGIKSEGIITVLIMIYQVQYVQIGTYYSNLIRILSGLMENFILKAWEYQKAVAAETYITGTSIIKTEYFRNQYDIQKDMMDNNLTSFRLIRILIEDRNLDEIDDMLQSKVRNNDILGLGGDGNIYLIAAQVDESSENIVLKRLSDIGLKCDIVENLA